MTKALSIIVILLTAIAANAAGLTFQGNAQKAVTDTPPSSTGLNAIYVLENTKGVSASYRASSASTPVKWYRYSNLGGAYSEPVAASVSGAVSTIELGADDMGYIVEEGSQRYYYWVVNYANHPLNLDDLNVEESDCSSVALRLTGTADPITYYTINGRSAVLDRGLKLIYHTLEYDQESEDYRQVRVEDDITGVSGAIHVRAPLCNTVFTLSGDRFATEWGFGHSASTYTFTTKAIDAQTSATQATREVDNEKKDGSDGSALGGSAPVDITFHAAVTDAVVFREWQFSSYADFDVVDLRFASSEVDYTFTEQGTTYVRFVAADASGECDFVGQVYQVFVGESKLECPNAFSPGVSEGVNDEWKVSYRSIIEFDCHIFNRWGTEMCSFTDPSQGWDGKYRGKLVPDGVYFYVIRAKGSDGKDYKLSGDINIMGYRRGASPGAGDADIAPIE